MKNVFLSLGTNEGNRFDYLFSALKKINENEKNQIEKISSIYESKPYGNVATNNFLNLVVKISSELNPFDLLNFIKNIEKVLGRIERGKWNNREIDIDIIFYNNLILKEKNLIIPHPYLIERDFVLIPLSEIASDFLHPELNKSVSEISNLVIEKYIIGKYIKQLTIKENNIIEIQ